MGGCVAGVTWWKSCDGAHSSNSAWNPQNLGSISGSGRAVNLASGTHSAATHRARGYAVTDRTRFRLAAAAFACAAFVTVALFVTPAQAQLPSDCPACVDEQYVLLLEQHALKRLESALQKAEDGALQITNAVLGRKPPSPTADERNQLSKLSEDRKEFETRVSTAQATIERLKAELAACIKERCGPGSTPAMRGDAPSSHAEPISTCHPACDDLAKAAKAMLYSVLRAERTSATLRSEIHDLRAWLAEHAAEQASASYQRNASSLGAKEENLVVSELERVRYQRDLDALMTQLGICNRPCPPPVTTSSIFPLGPAQEVPKAICPACEGAALKLKADLASLRFAQATQERDNARWVELSAKVNGGSPPATQADRDALSAIEKTLLDDERSIVRAGEDVAKSRIALDECNKLHPAESCVPFGSQSGLPGAPSQGGAKTVTGPDANPNPQSSSDAPGGAGGKSDTAPKNTTPKDTTPKGATPKAPAPGTGMLVPEGGGQSMARMNVGPGYVPDAKATAVFALEPGAFVTGRKFEFHGFIGSGPAYTVTSKTVISTIVGPDFGSYHLYRLPDGEYNMDLNASQLQILQGLLNTKTGGKSSQSSFNVVSNPCVQMQPILADAQGQPIADAYIHVGPPSPTPLVNPGERGGDQGSPTFTTTSRDGSYSLPLTGLTGPIEIGVAKGCDSYTSTATVDGTPGPRAGGSDAQLAQPAGTAR